MSGWSACLTWRWWLPGQTAVQSAKNTVPKSKMLSLKPRRQLPWLVLVITWMQRSESEKHTRMQLSRQRRSCRSLHHLSPGQSSPARVISSRCTIPSTSHNKSRCHASRGRWALSISRCLTKFSCLVCAMRHYQCRWTTCLEKKTPSARTAQNATVQTLWSAACTTTLKHTAWGSAAAVFMLTTAQARTRTRQCWHTWRGEPCSASTSRFLCLLWSLVIPAVSLMAALGCFAGSTVALIATAWLIWQRQWSSLPGATRLTQSETKWPATCLSRGMPGTATSWRTSGLSRASRSCITSSSAANSLEWWSQARCLAERRRDSCCFAVRKARMLWVATFCLLCLCLRPLVKRENNIWTQTFGSLWEIHLFWTQLWNRY